MFVNHYAKVSVKFYQSARFGLCHDLKFLNIIAEVFIIVDMIKFLDNGFGVICLNLISGGGWDDTVRDLWGLVSWKSKWKNISFIGLILIFVPSFSVFHIYFSLFLWNKFIALKCFLISWNCSKCLIYRNYGCPLNCIGFFLHYLNKRVNLTTLTK